MNYSPPENPYGMKPTLADRIFIPLLSLLVPGLALLFCVMAEYQKDTQPQRSRKMRQYALAGIVVWGSVMGVVICLLRMGYLK